MMHALVVSEVTTEMGSPRSSQVRASIMGIGSAVPKHVFQQKSFPDYYFEISNSNHMVDLKAKFAKICEKTMIEKRHLFLSDGLLRSNPSITAFKSRSINLRQELTDKAVPWLGRQAALVAIEDWGKQVTDITHLIFCTTSSGCMPGADFEVTKLLGLPQSTKRFMMYHAGCQGGGTALRLAKDIAENNTDARVLVLCSEVSTMYMRGPSESHVGNLLGQAMFGDAASAVIVGANPSPSERPLFELVSASQEIIPGSEGAIVTKLYEEGLVFNLHQDVPFHISGSIKKVVELALNQLGVVKDLNEDIFWVVHPGGRAILDKMEAELGLHKDKLSAAREVMRQYGNTLSSCVISLG